ncbi:MAG: RNA-binding S4 domain-containing protein, partial [Clostridia bacterium]|nr:RNA-binding S4 domain-containing protein [Clostridia bacterium]
MRLDKFLKISRIIKRRSVANDACATGHVTVNGKEGKPGTDVKVGDVLG